MNDLNSTLEAIEGNGAKQKLWSLELCPNKIQFTRDQDDVSYSLSKEHFDKKLELVDGVLFQRTLMVTLGEKDTKHIFHFEKPTFKKLKDWFGPPSLLELGLTLRKRMRWTLFLGAALIISALPQNVSASTGVEAAGFNYWSGVLGGLVILGGIAHMFKPHSILFLVDSVFFIGMGIVTSISIATGTHWAWGFLLPMDAFLVLTGIVQYRRFKGTLGQ